MKFNLRADAHMTLELLTDLSRPGKQIVVDDATIERVGRARDKLDKFVRDGRIIYGVNTSVGGLVHILVPVEKSATLQNNLINAVATNVGPYLDDQVVRAIMLARIKSLSRGNSGISVENFQKLVEMFNAYVIPCIPEKGSLGTSGDLGQLAAIALAATGQWKARFGGQIMPAAEALERAGIKPMRLTYKEGLALINGTSGMVGLGATVLVESKQLFDYYVAISALSCEGLAAKTKPFDPRVHRLKPHPGQQKVAESLWERLQGSNLAVDERKVEKLLAAKMNNELQTGDQPIEDAYSLRCTPQVLGPVLDSMDAIGFVIENELNSSNDNPLVIPEEDEVFHNGHFHGQYVAMAMDHLVIGLVTLCNLSDRRIDRFLTESNSNGLPPFLCREDPGLRLGLMGGQFMAASVTAENRSLTVPISVQSLTSTGGFQDIVSLGFVAARRAREVLRNTRYVVAFELLCACQAVDIRGADRLSSKGRALYERTRSVVPYLDHDVTLTEYLEAIVERILLTPNESSSIFER
jgi:phenylalanine aminomutase (D-beta-phenylalanine forming)